MTEVSFTWKNMCATSVKLLTSFDPALSSLYLQTLPLFFQAKFARLKCTFLLNLKDFPGKIMRSASTCMQCFWTNLPLESLVKYYYSMC